MAGDKITTGHIEGVGIAIGTGASVQIYGAVHYYPITLRAPLREVFDPLIEDRTRLFGGRDAALSAMADFIRSPTGGYLVVTAPAGFGKTALVASLVSGTPGAFAYHFFTPLYGDRSLSETNFLRNVVEQMAQWHGHKEQIPDRLDELQALYQRFIGELLDRTQVLVLDGLDEVTRWKLAPYLSRHLPDQLHILATVRDMGQDWMAAYGFPTDQTTSLPLGGLDRYEVAQVLRAASQQAAVFADDTHFLDAIMRVAAYRADPRLGTDPFYMRLLAEDIAKGNLTPANIAQQPQGLDAYLDHWWQQIKEMAGEKPARDLFGTLTVALGPIGRVELEAINPSLVDDWATDFFDDVLHKLHRWVVSDTTRGYALAHPRLRDYMRTHIKTGPYLDALLEYCAGWPKHKSPYALAYYAEHLKESGQNEALYGLIDKPWMDAKFEQTASHRAFAADVALAVEVARAEEPPNLLQEVHGRLIYVTLASLATKAPPEALGALAQVGQVSRALSFASLIRDQERQFQAYRLIGEALVSRGEMEHAREVFKQALTIVGAMREDGKASALAQIAPGLATMEELSRVTVIADAMGDQYLRAKALSCIAQSLAQVEQMDKAAEIAARALSEIEKIEDEATTGDAVGLVDITVQAKGYALFLLAHALNVAENPTIAAEVATRVLNALEGIGDEKVKAATLTLAAMNPAVAREQTKLAAVANRKRLAAQNIRDEEIQANILAAVIYALARAGDFDGARAATEEWRHEQNKDPALLRLAQALAEAAQFDAALAVAHTIGNETSKANALSLVIQMMAQSSKIELALKEADKLEGDHWFKSYSLSQIVNVLAGQGEYQQAQTVAEKIGDSHLKANTLAAIAEAIARASAADAALAVTNKIEDPSVKAYTLGTVALRLAQNGDVTNATHITNRALGTTQVVGEKAYLVNALSWIARAFTQQWQEATGVVVANQALTVAGKIGNEFEKAWALSQVAAALAEGGETERATKAAEDAQRVFEAIGSVSHVDLRWELDVNNAVDDGYIAVAKALAKVGKDAETQSIVDRIEDPGNKAKALSQVVDILVQMGQQAKAAEFARQALALIRSAGDETFIGEALVAAVQALVKAGEKQIAVEAIQETYRVAKSIADEENEGSGTNTLGVVAQALAEIGEHDQARAIAEALPDQFAKAQSLAKVTQALAQAGEKVKALALAKQTQAAIAEYGWASDNGQVLNTVVQALAQVGEYQAALAVARSIAEDFREEDIFGIQHDRANALREVYRMMVEADRYEPGLCEWREDLAKAQIRQSAFNTLGTGALLLAPATMGPSCGTSTKQ